MQKEKLSPLVKIKELFERPIAWIISMLAVFVLLIGIGLVRCGEESSNQPFEWAEIPPIIICQDSQYSLAEVESAVLYWQNLGYSFLGIVDDFDCGLGEGRVIGAITIGLPTKGYDYEKLAIAKVRADKQTGIIQSSRIEILTKKSKVLEHEIGHSLGFEHINIVGHLMHPTNSQSGWDSSGLEKKQKI